MAVSRQLGLTTIDSPEVRQGRRREFTPFEVRKVSLGNAAWRYRFFLEAVLRQHEVWSAWRGEEMQLYDRESGFLAPFWSHEAFAEAMQTEEIELVPIPIDEWIDVLVTGLLLESDVQLQIFPTPSDEGWIIEPDKFLVDLKSVLNDENALDVISPPGNVHLRLKAGTRPKGILP